MNELHSLLKRQLRRFIGETGSLLQEQPDFLQAINDAYSQFDADRRMLEHSLELTSQELLEANAELSRSNIDLEKRVMARTAELSDSEARFRELFEHAPVSIWEEDFSAVRQYIDDLRAKGIVDFSAYFDAHPEAVVESSALVKIVDVNRATLEMYQAESKAQLLADLSKVLGPESLIPFKEELLVLARGETSYESETINYTLRGERRIVFVRLTVAPGSEQTWGKVFVGISDITERRLAESALAAERNLLQALMDNIPDTIYFKDTASRFIRINRAQVRVLGVSTAEEATGKTDLDFQDSELARSFHEEEQRIIETGRPLTNRIEFNPTREGKPRWFSATKVPVIDLMGDVIGIVGVSRDITEQKQAEDALAAERDLLQALMDNIPDLIYFKDTSSRFTRINRAQASLLGIVTPEEAIGKTDLDFQDPELARGFYEEEQRLVQTGEALINRIEFNPTPDGQPRWLSTTKVPIKDTEGRVIGIVGVSRDITQRMHVEGALREAELKYRTLVEHMPSIIYVDLADESRKTIYISPYVQEMLGYSAEDWITKPDLCNDIVHPEDSERMWKALQESEAYGRFACDYRYIAKDGRVVWVHDEAVLLKNEVGEPSTWQGVMLDITVQKQAEEALSQSEERFRLMAWATQDAVWDWDLETGQILWGAGLQKIFRYSSETLETDTEWWRVRIHPQDLAKVDRVISQALEGGMEFWSKEYRFQRVDGTYADIMDRAYIIRDKDGRPSRMIGAMMDVTDRKQAEQALLVSEARYRQIVETAGDIIYRLDLDGNITYVNPTALRIMGYQTEAEILGRQYLEFVHPSWRDHIQFVYNQQFVEKTLNTYQEFLALTRDSKQIWLGQTVQIVMENDNVIGFQAVARDISSQKEAETALQELNGRMAQSINEIQQRNQEIALLNELSHLLQGCQSAKEAYGVIAKLSEQLFPNTAGVIYMLNGLRTQISAIASWGEPSFANDTFAPDSCRALRRSPTRPLNVDQPGMCCLNFAQQPGMIHCLPIQVQGETLGIFHLQSTSEEYLPENKRQLAYTVIEQSEMALSNLKLREALLEQSIRDPLTELYNRRYMEEALNQQLSRATRQLHPLGLIMIDIDHFKKFNDTYGHAAGDALLRELGKLLQSHIRGGDVACRYGGEEFLLIMPDASLEAAHQRAKQLQQEAKKLRVQDAGQSFDGVTLSLGIAIYPEHGRNLDSVLRAADAALYRAKQEGRDRVVVAERAQ